LRSSGSLVGRHKLVPTCFDHIGAAYIDRSAPYSTTPTYFNKATHGQYDTLHLILWSPCQNRSVACRPRCQRVYHCSDPHALVKWDVEGLKGLKELSFNPERSTGQRDLHSPFTWLAVFDVLLTVLDCQHSSPDHFHLHRPDGSSYPTRPIYYADDLQSFASTLLGLPRTADIVSVFVLVFNLTIATPKLRAFHCGGLSQPPDDTESLQIHAAGWVPLEVPIRHRGTFKSLGVRYPINPNDSTSLQLMKQTLIVTVRALSIKRASPRAINLVMVKCLYARGA